MNARSLGPTGLTVSALGLGCMGMSDFYGPADEAESVATIHAALDAGITLLDTGDYYAVGHNELLIREALRGRQREQAVVSVKFGLMRGPDGSIVGNDLRPAAAKNFLAYTLRRLGTEYVDVYRPGRVFPDVPIEETVGRDRRDGRGGLRPPSRPLRGRCRDDPPGPRRASRRRPADRVLADLARNRGGDPANLPRARDRGDRLRRSLPRPALRALVNGAGSVAHAARLPRLGSTLPEREPRAQSRARGDAAGGRRRRRAQPSLSSRSPGCFPAAKTSSRSSARAPASGSPRRLVRSSVDLTQDDLARIENAVPIGRGRRRALPRRANGDPRQRAGLGSGDVATETLTRERILEAAEEVLRRYGPAKANVVDVARAVGVSHGSVYRHFPSKAVLRDAVTARWLESISEPLEAIAAGKRTAPRRLERWLDSLVQAKRRKALDDPELFATYVELAADAREVVKSTRPDARRPAHPHRRRRRRCRRVRRRRPESGGARGLRRDEPLPQPRACRRMGRPADRLCVRSRSLSRPPGLSRLHAGAQSAGSTPHALRITPRSTAFAVTLRFLSP